MTLPKAQSNEKTNKQYISLSVKGQKFYINKQPVSFEELTTLMSKMDSSKDQTVIVRIPFNLQVQDLVDCTEIG
jgi:biopolymer transport protein ExbD